MSWKACGYVKELRQGLSISEKFVLLILAEYHRTDEKVAWPSTATLASDCLMTERGVRKILARLEDSRFIARKSGCGRGNVSGYEILGLDGVKEEPQTGNIGSGFKVERGNGDALKGEQNDTAIRKEPLEPIKQILSSPSVPTGEFKLYSEPTPTTSRKKKQSTADPRHCRFMELIDRAHKHFVHVPPVLNGGAGKNLQRLLKDCPKLDEPRFVKMLKFYHESDDHAPAESPMAYIPKLPRYETGPLNKFGRADAS